VTVMDKPPLDDPRWWPMQNAIKLLKAQTGGRDFAVMDLKQAMTSGKLRGMRRSRHNGEREHLSPPFENQFFVWFCSNDPEAREAENYPLDDWAFYVWKPDFDRLFSAGAPADQDDDSHSKEPLRAIERAEVVLRELYPTKAQMPRSLKEATKAVATECQKRGWPAPSSDTVHRAAERPGYRPPRKHR